MKTILIVALIFTGSFANLLFQSQEFVNHINSVQSQWTATHDNMFKNMSIEQVKSFLGTRLRDLQANAVDYSDLLQYAAVPNSFDARTQWPDCVHPIRDQQRCGSCWAFGASEAFSDRVCIATGGKINVILSPQYLVSCDKGNYGCQGGYLDEAWNFLEETGIPADTCVSYTSGGGVDGRCPSACNDGTPLVLYTAKNIRSFRRAADAKLDILTNGPIETGFKVYEDFMTYKSGVYKHVKGSLLGGHAIKVIGWGVEGGVKYWIAANSWGTKWGENGFFRIQEGECSFESQLLAGDFDEAN